MSPPSARARRQALLARLTILSLFLYSMYTSAAVVLKPSHDNVSAASIQSLVSKALPRHMVPVFVTFMDELPRNTVGKPDKRLLRDIVRERWTKQKEGGATTQAKL